MNRKSHQDHPKRRPLIWDCCSRDKVNVSLWAENNQLETWLGNHMLLILGPWFSQRRRKRGRERAIGEELACRFRFHWLTHLLGTWFLFVNRASFFPPVVFLLWLICADTGLILWFVHCKGRGQDRLAIVRWCTSYCGVVVPFKDAKHAWSKARDLFWQSASEKPIISSAGNNVADARTCGDEV